MQIEVVQYSNQLENDWDNFIENNNRNATFLHSRKFFKHNPLNEIDDASLLFYKKNKLIGVLPASLYSKDEKILFHSHPRSTYGGFVLDESAGVEEAMQIVEATIIFAKSKGTDEIIIRNPFRIFHQQPSDETDYAMWYHGFTIQSREVECAVRLDIHANNYTNETKRSIQKGLKNVTVIFSENFEEYWTILTENLNTKFKTSPVHTLQQILNLRSLVGKEKVRLIVAEAENKIIAGIVVFISGKVIHAQYIASDTNYQNFRPLNVIIDYLINWGKENGYQYLNLGTANEEAGKKINSGLFHFKEGFGARGILRETMHLILNDEK